MANVLIGKVSLRPMGNYDATTEYLPLDVVQYEGSSYIVRKACVAVTPEEGTYYMLAVSKGDQGIQGIQGERGFPGTGLKIIDYYDTLEDLKNNVQNPEVGDTYGIGATEPYSIYVYSKTDGWVDNGQIEGPKGPQGPKGDTGDSGVYIGDTEPTDPEKDVWIAPGEEASDIITNDNMQTYIDTIFQEMADMLTGTNEEV